MEYIKHLGLKFYFTKANNYFMKATRKLARWLGILLLTLLVLVILLVGAVYLPPVQRWLVNEATSALAEKTGLKVNVESVRLTPFFDLSLENVLAVDTEGDTIFDARNMAIDVAFLPLFRGQADIEGFSLHIAKIDTKAFVPDLRVKGRVGQLTAAAHGVAWTKEHVRLDRALLTNADVEVQLADTAKKDTLSTPVKWVIDVAQARIQNTTVRLAMPGDTMHVATTLGDARLTAGHFNLGKPHYAFRSLSLARGSAMMNTSRRPLPAGTLFDIAELATQVDTFSYDAQGRLRCRLRHLSMVERKRGLAVSNINGSLYLDSTRVSLPALNFRTPHSRISAAVEMDWRALTADQGGQMQVRLNGTLGWEDIWAASKGAMSETNLLQWKQSCRRHLSSAPIEVKASMLGNMTNFSLKEAEVRLPGLAELKVDGVMRRLTEPHRSGHLNLSARGLNLTRLEGVLPAATKEMVRLPHTLSAQGMVDFAANDYRTHLNLHCNKGLLAAKARVNLDTEVYTLSLSAQKFPIADFVKGHPLTPFSGTLSAQGKGFTPTELRSSLVAKADIAQFAYDRYALDGVQLEGTMRNGEILANFAADNPALRGKGDIAARIRGDYSARYHLDLQHLDLQKWASIPDTLSLGFVIKGDVQAARNGKRLSANGIVTNLRLLAPQRALLSKDIDYALQSTPDTTTARIFTGDLALDFAAAGNLRHLASKADKLSRLVMAQLDRRNIDQATIRRALPDVSLRLIAHNDNLLSRILQHYGYQVSSLAIDLAANATDGLNGHTRVGHLKSGSLEIDTIFANISHTDKGVQLTATAHSDRRTNPNPFTATLKSNLLNRGATADLTFADGQGNIGLYLGARTEMEKGGIRFHLYPETPIVAYRKFTINPDNYLFLGEDRRIRADVRLVADDGTGVQVYSEGADSTKNDITVSLSNVNLKELSNVVPYLPKMEGHLSGDFHLIDDHKSISAVGSVDARNFGYEGAKLGNLGAEVMYQPRSASEHFADIFLTFNNEQVAEVRGSYFNEGEGRFEGMAQLTTFPLQLLNGFLERTDFAMRGTAEGQLNLHGSVTAPVMNGTLDLNEAHLFSKLYGVDFTLDERPVVFEHSRLQFKDYELRSTDNNPLLFNGNVDMSNLDKIRLNLDMKAKNFALIHTKRQSESLIYGKVYSDFTGSVRGTLNNMIVRGNLDILGSTDVTYLLMNSPLSVTDELSGLVTFMDFADTIALTKPIAAEPTNNIDLSLGVNIRSGADFHCFLSHNGDSYIDVSGDGNLRLRMTQQGEMRLTGRLTLAEGKMNYELPVIPLRTFTLENGSFVEFKGNPMNPTLSIRATDHIKTIVTENDRQRAVNFNAGVQISRTLEDMGLEFTIEAPEDLSIQNQLTTMSAEDRGKAAVALLATGMYVTDDNLSAGELKASNALNAFLQNEIQNIAGKALSTVDLSFGMSSGVSATGASTTDYSFQFSKRFLNDRMRVIIGGKVSSGTDATGESESFIDNIALEYRLDTEGSRYVRVFYDRDSQDPFEGTLMKTGAGIILRRKSDKLGDLFLFRRKKQTIEEVRP